MVTQIGTAEFLNVFQDGWACFIAFNLELFEALCPTSSLHERMMINKNPADT